MAVAAAFGFVLQLLLETPRKRFNLGSIAAQVMPAIRLQQIEFCYDAKGKPIAYAVWALVSNAVSRDLETDPNRLLHPTEWNEGDELWIMDIVAPHGSGRAIANQLRHGSLRNHRIFRGIRRDAQGGIRRIAGKGLVRSQDCVAG